MVLRAMNLADACCPPEKDVSTKCCTAARDRNYRDGAVSLGDAAGARHHLPEPAAESVHHRHLPAAVALSPNYDTMPILA